MAQKTLRIGLIGAGANTRQRHIPGLRALPWDVLSVARYVRKQFVRTFTRPHG